MKVFHRKYFNTIILFFLVLLLSNCTKSNTNENLKNEKTNTSIQFPYPTIPVLITDTFEQRNYFTLHFWDNFDFGDSLVLQSPEKFEPFFVEFVALLQKSPLSNAIKSINSLLAKTDNTDSWLLFVAKVSEKYLYEPNSPLRNDELYIPVLEKLIASKVISETQKISPRFQLKLLYKNRIGKSATNIHLTTVDGEYLNLFQLKADFTIVFFYTPGCHSCELAQKQLQSDTLISKSLADKKLNVLAVCTEKAVKSFRKHAKLLPDTWINGWDKTGDISKNYDLKASPTIYLLDNNKTVVMKDADPQAINAYFRAK